jgi:hypothetical protein
MDSRTNLSKLGFRDSDFALDITKTSNSVANMQQVNNGTMYQWKIKLKAFA